MYRVSIEGGHLLEPWVESLSEHDKRALLSPLVRGLVRRVRAASEGLREQRVWHINSTEHGGGVAEMLPRIVFAARELGIATEWLVLAPAPEHRSAFYALTKHLHNNIHGDGAPLDAWAGCGGRGGADNDSLATCSAERRAAGLAAMRGLMDAVCADAAGVFFASFCPSPDVARDVVILHDPQPLALALALKKRYRDLKVIFRSHIGLDSENDATRAAWAFLAPYIDACDRVVFSNVVYVPERWRAKACVISPGIAPMSSKNRDLSPWAVAQVLTRAGLLGYEERRDVPAPRGCELIDAAFHDVAKIYERDLEAGANVGCVPCEGTVAPSFGIPFLHRPVVLQVSRFDRLKGFRALMLAFAALKERPEHFAAIAGIPLAAHAAGGRDELPPPPLQPLLSQLRAPGSGTAVSCGGDGSDSDIGDAANCPRLSVRPHDRARHSKMLRAAVLVLAGPDPSGVTDDPEAQEVLAELKALHDLLPRDIAADIKIVELPMQNALNNALAVNALQRASVIVVQNSLREGFGLTVAEAQYKRVACIGTQQACGLRAQIVHGVSGLLVQGDADVPTNVALAVSALLGDDALREACAVNGQKQCVEHSLIYSQMQRWLDLQEALLNDDDNSVAGERRADVEDALADADASE
jgi:trehalose synthase